MIVISFNFVLDVGWDVPTFINESLCPIVQVYEDFSEFKSDLRSEGFLQYINLFTEKHGIPKNFLYLCVTVTETDTDYQREFKLKIN